MSFPKRINLEQALSVRLGGLGGLRRLRDQTLYTASLPIEVLTVIPRTPLLNNDQRFTILAGSITDIAEIATNEGTNRTWALTVTQGDSREYTLDLGTFSSGGYTSSMDIIVQEIPTLETIRNLMQRA